MDIQLEKKHPLLKYKYYILAAIALLAFFIYLFIVSRGPSRLRFDEENLQIVEITQDKFLEYLDIEGLAQPKLVVRLNTLEGGTVERIVAEEGSMLKKGDTVLILSNAELMRTMNDEADELEKQNMSYEEKVLQMERRSSELRRTTLSTLHNQEKMHKQHILDKEEYEMGIKSKAQFNISSDDYNFNKENAALLLEELKHDSLMNIIQKDLMKNDLRREEKRFTRNRSRLENLIVRSSISGQLSHVSVTVGDKVGAESSIGELKVIDELKLKTKVSEYYIDRISLGLPASVMYLDKKYELKITKINPEIKDRQFDVDFVFVDEVPDNIRVGKSYRIQIELGQPEDAVVVDKGSFYQATGGQWIFKLNEAGDKAVKTEISVGRQNPRKYEILGGLKAGDKVIISGYDNFGDAQELILK